MIFQLFPFPKTTACCPKRIPRTKKAHLRDWDGSFFRGANPATRSFPAVWFDIITTSGFSDSLTDRTECVCRKTHPSGRYAGDPPKRWGFLLTKLTVSEAWHINSDVWGGTLREAGQHPRIRRRGEFYALNCRTHHRRRIYMNENVHHKEFARWTIYPKNEFRRITLEHHCHKLLDW